MQLPFTAAQFFEVFRNYNESVWPAQVALLALALVAIGLVAWRRSWSSTGVSVILALLWIWIGVAYHLAFFTAINPLAYAFAALSIAGGVAFFWQGVVRRRLEFRFSRGIQSVVAVVLLTFDLVIYPVWGTYMGHHYPSTPTFGLPCPTTLYTIGILCFLEAPYPRLPLLIPTLWCVIGSQAAFLLGVSQDLALIGAGVVGIALMVRARTPTMTRPLKHKRAA